jgi:hypothetical protein
MMNGQEIWQTAEKPLFEFTYGKVSHSWKVIFVLALLGCFFFPAYMYYTIDSGRYEDGIYLSAYSVLVIIAAGYLFYKWRQFPKKSQRHRLLIFRDRIIVPDYTEKPFIINTLPMREVSDIVRGYDKGGRLADGMIRMKSGTYFLLYDEYFSTPRDFESFLGKVEQMLQLLNQEQA